MAAVRVGPPTLRMAVVAAPAYLATHPAPSTPESLRTHWCINYRMMSANAVYAWEFERAGRQLRTSVTGPLTFNELDLMLRAAVDGLGVAYVLEHEAAPHVAAGRLVRLLEEWTPPFPGFCLYYPSRKQVSPVLAALVALLRTERNEALAAP